MADTLLIDTPVLPVECTPLELRWTGGTPPYNLTIATYRTVLELHPVLYDTVFTWTPNVTAGTPIMLFLLDHLNLGAASQLFLIQQGTDQSCITTTRATPQTAPGPKTGLSTGVLAGIGVAAALFVFIFTTVLLVWVHRRQRHAADRREDPVVDTRQGEQESVPAPTYLLPSSKANTGTGEHERTSRFRGGPEESVTSADSMSAQAATQALDGNLSVGGHPAHRDDAVAFPRPLAPRPRTAAEKRGLSSSVTRLHPSSGYLQGHRSSDVQTRAPQGV
ncbi:hypothetical protein BC628DRAFT_1099912 [Trametes gibbosa]|nr:hypothetical protein BC628DRAFT_1099912 [Trametes gibbosa]